MVARDSPRTTTFNLSDNMTDKQPSKPTNENPSRNRSSEEELQSSLERIGLALRGLKFGNVNIIVQDGAVIQLIERRNIEYETRPRQRLMFYQLAKNADRIDCRPLVRSWRGMLLRLFQSNGLRPLAIVKFFCALIPPIRSL